MASAPGALVACDWVHRELLACRVLAYHGACWADLVTCFLQVHQKSFQDHLLAFLDFQEEYQTFDDSFLVLQEAWAVLQEVNLDQEPDHDQVLQVASHFHLEAFQARRAYQAHPLT